MKVWWQDWAELIARQLARCWRAGQEARGRARQQSQAAPTPPPTRSKRPQALAAPPQGEEDDSADQEDVGEDHRKHS